MPALSYKSRFVDLVVNGSKPHSIRAWRKRPFRIGDVISHFTGPRMRPRPIRPATVCTSAASITIDADLRHVILGGYSPRYGFGQLTLETVEELARRDGFASVTEFFDFFLEVHGSRFLGQLIEWDPISQAAGATPENGEPATARKAPGLARTLAPLSPVRSNPRARGTREPRGHGREIVAATPTTQGAK